jgi:hypothetical protein
MNRQTGLLTALAMTLFACWWVSQADTETASTPVATTAMPGGAAKQRKPLAQAMPGLPAALTDAQPAAALPPTLNANTPGRDQAKMEAPTIDEANMDAPVVNLFAALPPPAAPAEALVEAGPVNPYTYAGRLLQEGRWQVFLSDGQQQYVVREGDRFAEGWLVTWLDQHRLVLQHAGERFEMMLENGGML